MRPQKAPSCMGQSALQEPSTKEIGWAVRPVDLTKKNFPVKSQKLIIHVVPSGPKQRFQQNLSHLKT